ncbi:RND family efflux transporter MFP subunit [Granulicella aggregans]|uniref:RND family efflux transporter MFP subunit n=1 Tax=Granulicella aggregans TaxID=474949 RepID=A0A7W8E409_9BACT|nr:efflux RND transporter periplasmic adaptor subunit [Granulicella aggregans]MBB5058533.1 RND family efflux transporter MFP subunit [Granulicella aggregans]
MNNLDGTNTDMSSPAGSPVLSAPPARGLTRGTWVGLIVVVIVLAVVVVLGIASRSRSEAVLETENKQSSITDVAIIHPTGSAMTDEIALPGNTQAYVDTPIYSRTSGYLKAWYFDIGTHVRKGQLMAVIETPELDQQLQVAQADLKSSQANLDLAVTTAARYTNLLKTNSVSKQETDVATGDEAAKRAARDASEANVRRLTQLQSFENIYAPFDGIVTARNTDVGALIEAGANTVPKELFHLAAIGKIRVFVAVPEAYSASIRNDTEATLTLDEYPGQPFVGQVARNSNQIDQASRTLNVEVDIDNAKGQLLPGAYVFVHFKVPQHSTSLTLPSNTLIFRSQGLQVATVVGDKVHLVPVKIGNDMGATVEIASGLQPSDKVVVDPSDSIAEGQPVRIADPKAPASEGGK